jgi:hypothetical protein
MTTRWVVNAILVVVVAIFIAGALLVWKPLIDPIETPKATTFNSSLVAKGAELADIGN